MQTLLNHSVDLIVLAFLLYLLATAVKTYYRGDKTMTDETLIQSYIDLERKRVKYEKATRVHFPNDVRKNRFGNNAAELQRLKGRG